jgi:hypothetical protein
MRTVAPRLPGVDEVNVAEDQHAYLTLVAAVVPLPYGIAMVTRWRLDDAERARIAAGEDIYLTLLTEGSMQPVRLDIGAPDFGTPERPG